MRGIAVAMVGCALLLAGCAGGESVAPSPTGTAVSPTLAVGTTQGSPFAGENPVHLLYISDSAGFATGEAYAALAEERLGVPVELVDWRTGGLSLAEVPDRIARESDVVAHAEIVVLWAGPRRSGVRMDILWCVDGDNLMEHDVYTVADWAPFADLEGKVLDAIWDARRGEPTVLLATDLYVPFPAKWEEHGIFDACMTSFETMSEALRVAAEAHGATFVSSLDTYNGPDHRRDPTAAGWIDEDGIHPGEAGAQAMAEALAAVGFTPAPAPAPTAPTPSKETTGLVEVSVRDISGYQGGALAGILYRGEGVTMDENAVGGFGVAIDRDPFSTVQTINRPVGIGTGLFPYVSDPQEVEAGTYTLWLWASEGSLSGYSRWRPAMNSGPGTPVGCWTRVDVTDEGASVAVTPRWFDFAEGPCAAS